MGGGRLANEKVFSYLIPNKDRVNYTTGIVMARLTKWRSDGRRLTALSTEVVYSLSFPRIDNVYTCACKISHIARDQSGLLRQYGCGNQ